MSVHTQVSEQNAKRILSALRNFGAPLIDLSESDFAADGFFQMGRPPVRIDVMMSIDGVQFENAWPNREKGDFDGVPTHFISRADLITNKTSSARPQDLIDIDSINTPRLKSD